MNVGYKDINTLDAARMLKVDKSSIIYWCANDVINYTNVSDGIHKKRYLISEDEIDYIKSLIKKHGKRNWRKFYDKNWNKKEMKPMNVITSDEAMFIEEVSEKEEKEEYPTVKAESAKVIEMSIEEQAPKKKIDFDEDKLLNSVLHIREVKEEIENCKARLAQLENEYKEYKQEILEWL